MKLTLAAALGGSSLVLGYIAKRLPWLGIVLGLGLAAVPVLLWRMFDVDHFRTDGSPGGLVLLIAYVGLGLVGGLAGLLTLRTSLAWLRSDELRVALERMPHSGRVEASEDSARDEGEDSVWMSARACVDGAMSMARAIAESREPVLIAARHNRILRPLLQHPDRGYVPVLEPHQLDLQRIVDHARGADRVHVLLVGLGDDTAREDRILALRESQTTNVLIHRHLSLEDLERGGLRLGAVRLLLDKLGLPPDEPIRHPMVSRAIARARRTSKR